MKGVGATAASDGVYSDASSNEAERCKELELLSAGRESVQSTTFEGLSRLGM